MAIAALVISIISLIVACVSVGWNAYAWINSGARLKIEVANSVVVPLEGGIDVLSVTVKNAGRLETEISRIFFPYWKTSEKSIEGGLVFLPEAFLSGSVPTVIAPGSEVPFNVYLDPMLDVMLKNDVDPSKMKVKIGTGHGFFESRFPEKVSMYLQAQLDARAAM